MSILIERETSAGSAGARRATRDPAGRDAAGVEDPEVREQAKRRRFSAEYKLRIVGCLRCRGSRNDGGRPRFRGAHGAGALEREKQLAAARAVALDPVDHRLFVADEGRRLAARRRELDG